MSREIINQFCQTLPGAECTDPWGGGHDAWKIGGKMFAMIGVMHDGVSVKTADVASAEMLIDMERAIKAPYFHRSWVRIPWGHVPDDELRERVETSYQLILSKLPKKVQNALRDANK
ncbi:MAG: MmcQ/YjbR family DNA-binding protein [Pseudomonadota bacterium]